MKISELPGFPALYQWLDQKLVDRDYGCIIGREGIGKSLVLQDFTAQQNTDRQRVLFHGAKAQRLTDDSFKPLLTGSAHMLIISEPYYWRSARYVFDTVVGRWQSKKAGVIVVGDPVKMLRWLGEDYSKVVVNKFDFPIASADELHQIAVAMEWEYLETSNIPWDKPEYKSILETAEGSAVKLRSTLDKIFTLVQEWRAPEGVVQVPLILPAARQVLGKQLTQWGNMPW